MGFRFSWRLDLEHDGERDGERLPFLIKWVAIGLAVLGIAAILIARYFFGS